MEYGLTIFKKSRETGNNNQWPGIEPFKQFDTYKYIEYPGFLVRGHLGVRGDLFGTHLDLKICAFDRVEARFVDPKKLFKRQNTLSLTFPPGALRIYKLDILTPFAVKKAPESRLYAQYNNAIRMPNGLIAVADTNVQSNEIEDLYVLHRPSPDGVRYSPYYTTQLMDMNRLCQEEDIGMVVKYMQDLVLPHLTKWM